MLNKKIQVLLVDDHAVVRNGVRLMLSVAQDILVMGEAETAEQAARLVRKQEFDVALVDIALAGQSGLDLLKRLRVEKPTLAVLILSMYSEEVYAVRALKLGAAGYLTKSNSATTMIEAVRKAATGGKYLSPALVERLANMIGNDRVIPHEALSDRELEVLKLLALGESLVNIAKKLHLSPKTVTTHRTHILEKMGMSSNTALVRYALENGLLI
ncbi:response regulator transcription factor [Glaciimonas sp. Gout2]|uniref:response regulator transcription factor n=1 Tax=unclassified Glaciimonas TaxID=2644401 RepID=UPI002B22C669|nr:MULTISPECIES: response regulator transcription factor [unclassified Glaciimonas]MEB0011137.1 response regulator transcription factor [Glaciimonas sp. Cout2]MEB0081185.1 response regulator transcription factor [Glaciimonas sp. Gout2]